MARIFRTEEALINGNIRLSTEGTAGAFAIQSAVGSTLLSRESIENDISSLAAKNSDLDADVGNAETQDGVIASAVSTQATNDTDIATKVGQRATKDGNLDGDVSTAETQDGVIASAVSTQATNDTDIATKVVQRDSKDGDLDGDVSTAETQDGVIASGVSTQATNDTDIATKVGQRASKDGDLDGDIANLETANETMDSDISSLAVAISENDVVAKSESVSQDDETATIAFGRTFSATPAVVASLRSSIGSDPVIPVMVTSVSTTNCTVSFGDGVPSDDYTVEVLASEV